MENGERLWQALQEGLPGVPLIETFPTATVRLGAHRMDALLPLALLGRARHADRRDVLDASVAAWVAAEWLAGRAAVAGEGSADGAIHY
jgi:predicted nuclease with RNAse H fold